ncbi:MAG: response regulator [Pseudomonadota bacterium]|nr:response regulator [Pseudomonadota bacterium]
MLTALDERGIPRSSLVEGTGVSLPHIERASQRIDWDVFADLCARMEALVGVEGLVSVGASSPKVPAMHVFVTLLGVVTHPVAIYRIVLQVVVPSMFYHPRMKLTDLGGGRLRVRVTIPSEYRDVPQLFYIFKGGLQINPTLCGCPPAEVKVTLAPHKAVYEVRFAPKGPSPWQRLASTVRGLLRLPGVFRVMAAQRDELQSSYEALRITERRIRRQRTLLRRSRRSQREAEAARRLAEEQFHRAQKLEGIGLLAGGVAHDFNNLLAGILGNAELAMLELGDAPETGGAVALRLERIQRTAERAAELTGQLLAYAGQRPPTTRQLDVNAIVRETNDLLRAAMPRSTVLHESLTEGLPAVSGDPIQLQQVVMNLLTNAVAAVESTGGEVALRSGLATADADRLARGWLRAEATPGEFVYVEVSDTGVGMDEATLARIFDPFFTTRALGRGLGLAAVLGIVRAHRGIIEVASSPGAGSTFRVLLPSLGHPLAAAVAAPRDPLPRRSGTVLVVDDEESVRDTFADLLEARGYTVLRASDGEAALEAARTHGHRIDAYLVDRSMPRMGGEDVFRGIRALRPDAKVILCSGYHDPVALRALFAEGLTGALAKPFGSRALEAALARALPDPAKG